MQNEGQQNESPADESTAISISARSLAIATLASGIVAFGLLVQSWIYERSVFLLLATVGCMWFVIGLVFAIRPPGLPILKPKRDEEFPLEIHRRALFDTPEVSTRMLWAFLAANIVVTLIWFVLFFGRTASP